MKTPPTMPSILPLPCPALRALLSVGAAATVLLAVLPSGPAHARAPCNRYAYDGMPNPAYPAGRQQICKHDLQNNDDQFEEFYTYRAWNMDGHLYQHQDQFRKFSLFPKFYYGLIDPNGYWQWQQTERFDLGDYSNGGITSVHQFAMSHPNGAWQHEYAWRNSPTDTLNYCYAQSGFDERGRARAATYFCNLAKGQVSGDASPVPLRNPSFRFHTDW